MAEPRKPDEHRGDEVDPQPEAGERNRTGKTLQELERLQFAELERER